MTEKPPLGVEPKYLWIMRRRADLESAILRYIDAGFRIPIAWVEEYNSMTEKES